jgi:metallo-beta-lactamase family protein
MNITFLGAAGGVTGSKHLLEAGGQRILLDCGFFQGRRAETYQANSVLPDELKATDVVILSHAHADHCCSLPLLVKDGYNRKIYATPATAAIAHLIMLDAAKIQMGDYEHLKRNGFTKIFKPVYDEQDVENASHLFKDLDYHVEQKIGGQVSFKFYDAGHILGSAVTLVKTPSKNIIYTGDLGNIGLPILPDPEVVEEEAEIMISECTYGDRDHPPVSDAQELIKKIIKQAVAEKSRIIVPAFALGRTQELIYILHKLYKDGEIPGIPVYIDSPLSNNITEVFKKYSADFDFESWRDFLMDGKSPFSANQLNYIQNAAESQSLNNLTGPLIIIASSGMLEGGRILHHLRNDISNPQTTILLTGYQAENTLGRKLESGAKRVSIYGEEFDVRSRILKLNELSAHADRSGLLRYINKVRGLKKLFLVHGETESAVAFAALVAKERPDLEVIIPKLGESFDI